MPNETQQELPLWANLLEQPVLQPTKFLSENLEEHFSSAPLAVTFYSLRGGVGRTTALAYTALALVKAGKRVICIDSDLEAPGLSDIFGLREQETSDKGLVPLLIHLEYEDMEPPKVLEHILRYKDEDLYVLPAGILNTEYARALRWLDMEAWYRGDQRNPIKILMRILSNSQIQPDVILLDARTGISQTNAPFLFDMSDMVVVCLYPHPQAERGNELVVQALGARKNYAGFTTETRFILSPLPAAPEIFNAYKERGITWIQKWLKPYQPQNTFEELNAEELTHAIPYTELLAGSDTIESKTLNIYADVATWILDLLPPSLPIKAADNSESEIEKEVLAELLSLAQTNTGVAEQNDLEKVKKFFVKSSQYEKLLDNKTVFIIGRKGTGKTELFRHFIDIKQAKPLAIPKQLQDKYPSYQIPNISTYQEWDKQFQADDAKWRRFWLIQTLISIDSSIKKEEVQSLPEFELAAQLDGLMNVSLPLLVVDGLDDGFGSDTKGLQTRLDVIKGLLDFWYQYAQQKIPMKIFIRYDLWEKVIVVNKSHFYGYDERLVWTMEDYLKVITKIAAQSEEFRKLYAKESGVVNPLPDAIEWEKAWNLLFGERIDSKNAYAKNWFWKRLADANDEHSVRLLLVLFKTALESEKNEIKRTRVLIRSSKLKDALPTVSQQAITALQEEYGVELADLLRQLEKTIQTTPFSETELNGVDKSELDLARTIGLIKVRSDGRLAIPDLYRISLNMSRQGPG